MKCLSDTEIQTVVDAEAAETVMAHVAACGGCRDRVEARRQDMAMVTELLGAPVAATEDALPALTARVRAAMQTDGGRRGATSLRAASSVQTPPRSMFGASGRNRWALVAATAAVVLVVVFGVLPKLGAPTTLSASEVLGRSLKTMAERSGVERLEYELFVAGDMPGPHRIEHVIDHDHPGRYRFSNFGSDGVLESAIAQDPARAHRVQLLRVDGRNYIIDLNASGAPKFSLPDMGHALVESAITMMQATSDQNLSVVEGPAGRQYVVEIPAVTPSTGATMFDIYHARAVIDAASYRIQQFEASGSMLRQPFSVSFKLITRTVRPSAVVPAGEFAIPSGPDDSVILGSTEHDPVTDVIKTVLRELGRTRGLVATEPARKN